MECLVSHSQNKQFKEIMPGDISSLIKIANSSNQPVAVPALLSVQAIDVDNQELPAEVSNHIIGRVAMHLGKHIGIPCDTIILIEFLGLLSGRMANPVNLDIVTADLTADLYIINRLLELGGTHVMRITDSWQLRKEEEKDFANLWTVLVQGTKPTVFRDATEIACRAIPRDAGNSGLPSIWRIADQATHPTGLGPTIHLVSSQNSHNYANFPNSFCGSRITEESH